MKTFVEIHGLNITWVLRERIYARLRNQIAPCKLESSSRTVLIFSFDYPVTNEELNYALQEEGLGHVGFHSPYENILKAYVR